ncbi:flagellar motor switch phosphatase FliY [Robertmurraya siralis]|uniref:Flagellar motor switch phosphatase FliY n=1 Tax=Robertmurraya siralis TaxID=77777 RepID=A0A920BTD5_9BACI|nr:flagellar motor switch phosphatase FliY [Robertmurraya siralis]PAE21398.1 flagellar motor switch phosphatase FliY [Bacillus sp. 7504-2]GIN61536.1 flagellar motor switch phosphatase FliY [Robertmurraya siralis]
MVSDDMLSQDEIDALLKGTDDVELDSTKNEDVNVEEYLTVMEQDALGEIGNISFGSSATALSTLLNQKVDITTPTVSVILKSDLEDEFPHPYVAIQVKYTEGFSGTNLLVVKQEDAAIIADLMLGGDGLNPAELLGEIQLSAVQEAMNQMMGSSATSMSTIFSKKVDISPPTIDMLDIQHGEGTEKIPKDDMLVKVSFRLRVGELIDSSIMQLLPLCFAKELVAELLNPSGSKTEESASSAEAAVYNEQPQPASAAVNAGAQASAPVYSEASQQSSQPGGYQIPPMQQPMAHHQPGPQHYGAQYQSGPQPTVQPAMFSSFDQYQLQESEAKNLNMLFDIPLQVTVELGRTKRSVKEILELSPGSIIELDKLAGEPVDILVNNRLIAKGEVVVIDENFGVRVTDIISQTDRLNKLR